MRVCNLVSYRAYSEEPVRYTYRNYWIIENIWSVIPVTVFEIPILLWSVSVVQIEGLKIWVKLYFPEMHYFIFNFHSYPVSLLQSYISWAKMKWGKTNFISKQKKENLACSFLKQLIYISRSSWLIRMWRQSEDLMYLYSYRLV